MSKKVNATVLIFCLEKRSLSRINKIQPRAYHISSSCDMKCEGVRADGGMRMALDLAIAKPQRPQLMIWAVQLLEPWNDEAPRQVANSTNFMNQV